MLHLDIQYVGLLSLDRMKCTQKHPRPIYNFRCPICGDSAKDRIKARGYLYVKGDGLVFHCHNCQAHMRFGDFVREVDEDLYREYIKELLATRGEAWTPPVMQNDRSEAVFDLPEQIMPILTLPPTHPVIRYVRRRQIPRKRWDRLYSIAETRQLGDIYEAYKDRFSDKEPRLIMPCRTESGRLTGLMCRAVTDNAIRYVNVRIDEDEPVVFGLDAVRMNRQIFVVEGAIDSLFLRNAVAVGGSGLFRVAKRLPVDTTVYVFDNQPRNEEIVKLMRRCVGDGLRVCFWPETPGKDINEMILAGLTASAIEDLIVNHTRGGLQAELEMRRWAKC